MAYLMNGSLTLRGRSSRAGKLAGAALALGLMAFALPAHAAVRGSGAPVSPAVCDANGGDPLCKGFDLDQLRWKELEAVQMSLRAVHQVSEKRDADTWQVADRQGDCEDIALLARARLLAAGWPLSAVRLATAWTEEGAYHTVLTIDGVRNGTPATFVLDNRFPIILSYQKLEKIGYRFHMRQAASGPTWVTVRS